MKELIKRLLKSPSEERAKRETTLLDWCDIDEEDVAFSRKLLFAEGGGNRIRWLLCRFNHPFGGVFTVLRMADMLQKYGYASKIVIYDDPNFDISPMWGQIERYFPHLAKEDFLPFQGEWSALPGADIAVATFWPSAYHLLRMRDVTKKVLLVQDFEPAFYPAGTEYALAENALRMPFSRLFNTPGLLAFVERNYPVPSKSAYFTPACDERYMLREKPLQPPYCVLFYARPDAPRNAFSLCVAFSKALKRKYGEDVDIVCAGASLSEGEKALFEGCCSFAGVVPYENLPEFYGSFHFVVSFMLTKHPSYLPFEAMACGCVPIVNLNEANLWLLKNGENCLMAQAAVTPLMEAFARGLNPELYCEIVAEGHKTVRSTSWESEMEKIAAFFRNL
jgi:glycosyltransferase involved in cell wall biosynthesis